MSLTAEDGGPERAPGVLAVSPDGDVAFTFGYASSGKYVTVVDSMGRVRTELGAKGSGPGEFNSVLAVFFESDRVYLFGVGQLSAFSMAGRHIWSRAMPPLQMAVAVQRDSVDLMEASNFMDGRAVGTVWRRSVALNGGARVLYSGADAQVRELARGVDDTTRFPRLAYATSGARVFIGHSYAYRLLEIRADRTARYGFGKDVPVLRRTSREVAAELDREVRAASAPFRLPDGTTRKNPVPVETMRARLEGPMPYFSARDGGLQVDRRTGDPIVIETHSGRVTLVRFRRYGTDSTQIDCDARKGGAALNWPFLALTCASPSAGDNGPVLRLYRLQ